MSDLWNVEVIRLAEREVTLRVTCVHPDAGPFTADAVFALRMLYESARGLDDSFTYVAAGPLGELAYHDIRREEWMRDNAGRFIASVRTEADDLPAMAPVGMSAVYVIEATDPRWLAHLSDGQVWDSAAYS